jgi:hypothetical protein
MTAGIGQLEKESKVRWDFPGRLLEVGSALEDSVRNSEGSGERKR